MIQIMPMMLMTIMLVMTVYDEYNCGTDNFNDCFL